MAFNFPGTLYAGDTVEFTTLATSEKSAPDFTLAWAIRGLADSLDVTAAPTELGNWLTTINGADTANLEPGSYGVFGTLTSVATGARETVFRGVVRIEANPATLDDYDPRTEAEKTLDSITAAIKTRVDGGVSTYSIEGRSASYYSLEELLKLRDRYVAIVEKEKAALAVSQGLPNPNRLRVRFY